MVLVFDSSIPERYVVNTPDVWYWRGWETKIWMPRKGALSQDRLQLWVEWQAPPQHEAFWRQGSWQISRLLRKLPESCLPCFVYSNLLWLCAWRGHHSIGPCLCGNCGRGGKTVVRLVISSSLRAVPFQNLSESFRIFQRPTDLYWSILLVFTAVSTPINSTIGGIRRLVSAWLWPRPWRMLSVPRHSSSRPRTRSPRRRTETNRKTNGNRVEKMWKKCGKNVQKSESAKVKCLRTRVEKIMKDSKLKSQLYLHHIYSCLTCVLDTEVF